MTRYELRAIGRMVYGAAIMTCSFTRATVRASLADMADRENETAFFNEVADRHMRALVLEYRANGGEVDAGERDE